jgi:transposase-like protein
MPKSYSKEFRESIVTLASRGQSINSLAKKYTLSNAKITRWLNRNKAVKVGNKEISYDKYIKMEKENAELKEQLEILKRAAVLTWKTLNPDEIISFINDSLKRGHRLCITLKAFQMPKASYYYWKNHQETKTHKFDQLIKKEILVAWFHNHCIYGYPRIHKVLQNKGYSISAKKVWKLMKHLDIHSIMNKKFRKPTTTNDYAQRPNLVNGNWKHFWCADITYIQMSNHK